MKKILIALTAVLIAAYPLLVYYGLSTFSTRFLLLFIITPLLIRYYIIRNRQKDVVSQSLIIVTLIGIAYGFLSFILDNALLMKFYPAVMSFSLFFVFLRSLIKSQAIITVIAEKISKEPLPQAAVEYTGYVTIAWCIFFALNSLVAVYTVFFSTLAVWTLYNGLISYLIIGTLIIVEFPIRLLVKKRAVIEDA
jgi:uncharacterized membrane protein